MPHIMFKAFVLLALVGFAECTSRRVKIVGFSYAPSVFDAYEKIDDYADCRLSRDGGNNEREIFLDALENGNYGCLTEIMQSWTSLGPIEKEKKDILVDALELAIFEGDSKIVKLLVSFMADRIDMNEYELLPAHLAMESTSSVRLTKFILMQFPNLTQKTDSFKQNIFHHVLRLKPLRDIRPFMDLYLLHGPNGEPKNFPTDFMGASLTTSDAHGYTPLDYIVKRNDLESLMYFYQNRILFRIPIESEVAKWMLLSIIYRAGKIFRWIVFESPFRDSLIKRFRSDLLVWIIQNEALEEAEIDSLLTKYFFLAKARGAIRLLDRKFPLLGFKYIHALFSYHHYDLKFP